MYVCIDFVCMYLCIYYVCMYKPILLAGECMRRSYSVNILKARDILSFEMFVSLLSKDAQER